MAFRGECAVSQDLQLACFLVLRGSTLATLSLHALANVPIDIKAFAFSLLMKILETFDHLVRIFCTMVLAVFILREGFVSITE